MTFGQHLQELRVVLFKAIAGLFLGMIVGMTIGSYVVDWIQQPLRAALEDYYKTQAKRQAEEKLKAMQNEGKPLPESAEQVRTMVERDRLLPEVYYVNPAELVGQLKQRYPEQFKSLELPSASAESTLNRNDLLRMFLWHSVEDDQRLRVKALSVQEGFGIYMKAAMLAGVVLASPWIFYQIWSFVAAGLYPHEKRYIHIFLPFSLGLFFLGAATVFLFVFRPVLNFLFYFNASMGIEPDPRISEWLGFVMTLPLAFGAAFQLPLVMLFLERIGVVTIATLWSYWRVAVLAIAVIAMLLTPDPSSMMIMVIPLTFLYFGGIGLCHFMPKHSRPKEFVE